MKMLGEDRRRSEVGTGRSGVPMLVSGMHRRRWEISELKKEKVQYNGFMLLCIESSHLMPHQSMTRMGKTTVKC